MNNQFGRLAFACTSMLILTACGGGGAANAPQTQSPPPAGTYVSIDSRTGTSTALAGDGVYVSSAAPADVEATTISGTRQNSTDDATLSIKGTDVRLLSGIGDNLGSYEYVNIVNVRTLTPPSVQYVGTVGAVTSTTDVPTQGMATYAGEATLSSTGGSDEDGKVTVAANFGAGTVDTTVNSAGDPNFDEINVSGMQISGNSFSGGTMVTSLNGASVDVTGSNTDVISTGHFYGYDHSLNVPDEVGGVILAKGDDGAIAVIYRAD